MDGPTIQLLILEQLLHLFKIKIYVKNKIKILENRTDVNERFNNCQLNMIINKIMSKFNINKYFNLLIHNYDSCMVASTVLILS